jgi:hypothetical protein
MVRQAHHERKAGLCKKSIESEYAEGGIRAIAEFQIAMDEIGDETEELYKFIINDQIYDAKFKGTVEDYN